MKSFKVIVNICVNSFRQWMTNYRIWCIGLLILLLIHLFTSEIRDFVIMTDTKITPYIFPFFFTQKYIRLLFLFPLTLLHCDAPFVNSIQKHIIIRAGRKKWIISQIMYIVCSSFVYFAFTIFFSIIINLPYMTFDTEWGKVINTLYRTDAASQIGLKLVISGNIPEYFTPFQSMYFSFLLLSMSGIFIGLIICCVNTFSKNRAFGVLVASVFLIVDAAIDRRSKLIFISPISWNNISTIVIGGITKGLNINYVLTSYTLIFCFLVLVILLNFQRNDIEFLSEYQ